MKSKQLVILIKSLKDDLARLQIVSELLDQQYVALRTRNSNSLEEINEQAITLIDVIQSNQRAREKVIDEMSHSARVDSMVDFVKMLPEQLQTIALPLANEIRAFNKLCKVKNERNGMLLSSQKQLLQSITGGKTTNLYPEKFTNLNPN